MPKYTYSKKSKFVRSNVSRQNFSICYITRWTYIENDSSVSGMVIFLVCIIIRIPRNFLNFFYYLIKFRLVSLIWHWIINRSPWWRWTSSCWLPSLWCVALLTIETCFLTFQKINICTWFQAQQSWNGSLCSPRPWAKTALKLLLIWRLSSDL